MIDAVPSLLIVKHLNNVDLLKLETTFGALSLSDGQNHCSSETRLVSRRIHPRRQLICFSDNIKQPTDRPGEYNDN